MNLLANPIYSYVSLCQDIGFPSGSVVKNPPANEAGTGSIPGLRRSPGEGNGKSVQYSCLENPMNRGAWLATSMGSQRVRQDWATEHTCSIYQDATLPVPELMARRPLEKEDVLRRVRWWSGCMSVILHATKNGSCSSLGWGACQGSVSLLY